MAPFLFNIAAEGLSGMMRKPLIRNCIQALQLGETKWMFPFYSMRMIPYFSVRRQWRITIAIKVILRTFEMVSGLKINFAKSSFGVIGMLESWKQNAAKYLNCSLLAIPFVYLGIPIGENPRRCQLWDPIIHKCERKLAKWKQRHISFGGRVTLIQSILTSIPIYFFIIFQDSQKGGGQVVMHTKKVSLGWRSRPTQDCMG